MALTFKWERQEIKMMDLFFDIVVVLLATDVPVKRPPGRRIFGAEL